MEERVISSLPSTLTNTTPVDNNYSTLPKVVNNLDFPQSCCQVRKLTLEGIFGVRILLQGKKSKTSGCGM